MKQHSCLILIIFALGILSCNRLKENNQQTVNPVIGDESFITKFGYKPSATTDNELRIKTHLAYAEQLLRLKETTGLAADLQANRIKILNLLHKYWTAELFPKNYDYKEQRKSCFIDKDGTICAVGYLVEQTTNREVAEALNKKFKYDELLAMNDKILDSWIASSGLTKQEFAMIQPTYGAQPAQPMGYSNYIEPAYGVSTAVLGGISLSLNTLNGIQMARGSNYKFVPYFGLATGASQVILGASNFPEKLQMFNGNIAANESQKTLSLINIGLGTTTLILSALNLITHKKPVDKATTFQINSFTTPYNNAGLALNIVRKF